MMAFLLGGICAMTMAMDITKSERTGVIAGDEAGMVSAQRQASSEDFWGFWRSFCNNPSFQKSRVKIPLRYIIHESYFDDYGEEINHETTSFIYEWKYEKPSEEFEIQIEKDHDSYKVYFDHKQYQFSLLYVFNQYEGKWYLTEIHQPSI